MLGKRFTFAYPKRQQYELLVNETPSKNKVSDTLPYRREVRDMECCQAAFRLYKANLFSIKRG